MRWWLDVERPGQLRDISALAYRVDYAAVISGTGVIVRRNDCRCHQQKYNNDIKAFDESDEVLGAVDAA